MEVNIKRSCGRQILTAVLANIPALTYGIQIGWLSPMALILQSAEDTPARAAVSDNAISWMAAALPMAALVSVPLFSYLPDRFGRRKSIILLSILSSISWILKLSSPEVPGLICARSLAGIAACGCFIVVPMYVREISDDNLRGTLGSLLMTSCNIGVILVYVLGAFLSYHANQWVYLAITVCHVLLFFFMPESPDFLVKKELDEEAAKTIAWLRTLGENHKLVHQELTILKEQELEFRAMPKISIIKIIGDDVVRRPLAICFVLIGVQTLSGCFAVVNYAAAILQRAGSDWSPNLLALFVGALQLAGSLVAVATVERFGRKILMAGSCLVISACMATLATSFYMGWSGLPPVLAVCACIFSYGAGLGPVPFIVMAEVFSFHLRARLLSGVMALSWLNSTLTVLLFGTVASAFGEHAVFFTFAAITLFGAIFTVACLPETKGKSLEEIQTLFTRKKQ